MRERIMNFIGFGLLALCFAVALARTTLSHFRSEAGGSGEKVTLRFAHWQLESGPRDAFEKMAQEYMKLHPQVRIQQIPIPERIYQNWLVTQLVGGTAPDLIQLGLGTQSGAGDERVARFFTPLSEMAQKPNPYNQGTELENTPLRETLFDGMEGGYYHALLEYYSVPISAYSIRLYVNLEMLKEITGSEAMPQNYDEFIELCRRTKAFSEREKRQLVPIAGSKYNAPLIMDNLFAGQTQKLLAGLRPPGVFAAGGVDSHNIAIQYFRGGWSLDSPAIRSALDLMHEVGQFMQPGFMQLLRDDAMLLFVQGRALMICTGSWDATSIRRQARFRIGVCRVPYPEPSTPKYGEFTLGAVSEAGATSGVGFGLTRGSRNPEVAKDFLLFLASKRINKVWTETSGWLPSIINTEVNEEVRPFLPITEGYPAGFRLNVDYYPDLQRLTSTNLHHLVGALGSTEAFVDAVKPEYGRHMARSLKSRHTGLESTVRRGDTQLAASAWIAGQNPEDEQAAARLDLLLQTAAGNTRNIYLNRLALDASEGKLK